MASRSLGQQSHRAIIKTKPSKAFNDRKNYLKLVLNELQSSLGLPSLGIFFVSLDGIFDGLGALGLGVALVAEVGHEEVGDGAKRRREVAAQIGSLRGLLLFGDDVDALPVELQRLLPVEQLGERQELPVALVRLNGDRSAEAVLGVLNIPSLRTTQSKSYTPMLLGWPYNSQIMKLMHKFRHPHSGTDTQTQF